MSVDLTLPASSSPAIDPYKDKPEELLPFALFVHVLLAGGDEELARIEAACNSQTEGVDAVQRAVPRHDFAGQPLRAALSEHLEKLLSTGRFSPFYFAAVVDADWKEKGLIIVTMNDWSDEENWHIDQLRVPVDDVGSALVNLQIANTDWDELKEQYEEEGDDEEDDKGEDDDDDN